MKILIVHNAYQRPGGEDVIFQQERQLLERMGHRVLVYARSNREIEGYSPLRRIHLPAQVIWSRETHQEVAALLQFERPDLVHVHNTFLMVSPAIFAACREAQVPVVHTVHNYRLFCPAANFFRGGRVCEECVEHSLWRAVRYGCYRDSRPASASVALMLVIHRAKRTWQDDVDYFIATCESERRKLIACGLPAAKVVLKPNFVLEDPGVGNGSAEYALFVGRLAPEKGVRALLAAWRLLGRTIPLLIVGDGPLRGELEAEAEQSNLSSVRFLGQLARREVLAAMRTARFLIAPSEVYETFGMTLAEGFACGRPVVCSRLGAMQDMVVDGQTGLHFRPGDAADLCEKVEWAWNHPERMAEMGRAARCEYQAKYTAEANYPRMMEIYSRAIAGRRRGA